MRRYSPSLWLGVFLLAGHGCVSSEVDPRITVEATPELTGIVAQSVNASEFWQEYFDELGGSGEPLVRFALAMNRRVTSRTTGGDYDPGVVDVTLRATSLRTGTTLVEKEATVDIDPVIFGRFDESMTRDDIQRKAFESTERKIHMHVELWVNVAALRAMAEEGPAGSAFLPFLEKTARNPWGEHIPDEANTAIRRIRGGN
jgi:hypothetical protein